MIVKNKIQLLKLLFIQKDYSFVCLLISILLLPLSINLSTFAFILALGFKIVQILIFKHPVFSSKGLRHSGLVGLIFFVYILSSSVIQTSFDYTFNMFEKQFSHWTLLFLSPMLMKDRKFNVLLAYTLILGSLAALSYVFVLSLFSDFPFDRKAGLNILGIHHTYWSLYLLAIINFLLIDIVKDKNKPNLIRIFIESLIVLICLLVIFSLESKVAIVIAMLIFIIHFIPQFLKSSIWKSLFVLASIVMILFLFNQKITVSYEKALDFRLQLWEASTENIDERPFFGNLKQSEKDLLNFRHYVNGKYYFLDSDLNSHNQYLSIILKYGIFGGFILLVYVVNLYKKTNKKTEIKSVKEFIGFAVILIISFYIENVMDRHHGIVFATVFYNYYLVEIENT